MFSDECNETTLAQLMYVLSQEDKYSSKLYHYVEKEVEDPEPCDPREIDLSILNKHEFGLVKMVGFENMEMRSVIESEINRRNGGKSHGK